MWCALRGKNSLSVFFAELFTFDVLMVSIGSKNKLQNLVLYVEEKKIDKLCCILWLFFYNNILK